MDAIASVVRKLCALHVSGKGACDARKLGNSLVFYRNIYWER
jgi:hypothetical protein